MEFRLRKLSLSKMLMSSSWNMTICMRCKVLIVNLKKMPLIVNLWWTTLGSTSRSSKLTLDTRYLVMAQNTFIISARESTKMVAKLMTLQQLDKMTEIALLVSTWILILIKIGILAMRWLKRWLMTINKFSLWPIQMDKNVLLTRMMPFTPSLLGWLVMKMTPLK